MINVENFRFGFPGGTSDTATIRRAFNAATTKDIILFPGGRTYRITGDINVPSDVTVLAWGTVFDVRPRTGAGLSIVNQSNVKILGGCWEYRRNWIRDGAEFHRIENSTDITFDCVMVDIQPTQVRLQDNTQITAPPYNTELHAFFATDVTRLTIEKCTVDGGQITSDASADGLYLDHNYIVRSRTYGIRATAAGAGEAMFDVRITRNRISTPWGQGGILLGTRTDLDTMDRLSATTVHDNTVEGDWPDPLSVAILARTAVETDDLEISRNHIRGGATRPDFGILVQAPAGTSVTNHMQLSDNFIRGCTQQAIRAVGGTYDSVQIARNSLNESRGIEIIRGGWRNPRVINNQIDNAGNGACVTIWGRADAIQGNTFFDAEISGNGFRNALFGVVVNSDPGAEVYLKDDPDQFNGYVNLSVERVRYNELGGFIATGASE